MGKPPRFKRVPVGLLDAIITVLSVLGKLSSKLADKAELARIGRYYATESMLLWDEKSGRYDADATPSTGGDTLWQHYQNLVNGGESTELGDHSVF
jgi:divinyl chlorophyllide a 8-vinyl-reductase